MGFYSDQEQREIISKNLMFQIELSGKGQKEIAIDLDVNPPTFNQWVTGKAIPSVSMLKKIANYFDVSLLSIVDPPDKIVYEPGDMMMMPVSYDEKILIRAYRSADQGIQLSIKKLLDL